MSTAPNYYNLLVAAKNKTGGRAVDVRVSHKGTVAAFYRALYEKDADWHDIGPVDELMKHFSTETR